MASKKKGQRINVAMRCKECNKTTHYTEINKANNSKLETEKYCNQCKKHVVHVSKDKLK